MSKVAYNRNMQCNKCQSYTNNECHDCRLDFCEDCFSGHLKQCIDCRYAHCPKSTRPPLRLAHISCLSCLQLATINRKHDEFIPHLEKIYKTNVEIQKKYISVSPFTSMYATCKHCHFSYLTCNICNKKKELYDVCNECGAVYCADCGENYHNKYGRIYKSSEDNKQYCKNCKPQLTEFKIDYIISKLDNQVCKYIISFITN